MIDLDNLERLAFLAQTSECGNSWPDETEWLELYENCEQHGKFLHAFNPAVAQELISRLREAEAERDDLRDKLMTELEESFDLQEELNALKANCSPSRFNLGDRVKKRKGSQWQGRIVGWYSTNLTPEGYAVESESHPGSVQIYPAAALEFVVGNE